MLRLLEDEKLVSDNLCKDNCNHITWMQHIPIRNTKRSEDMIVSQLSEHVICKEVAEEAKKLLRVPVPKFDRTMKGTKIAILTEYKSNDESNETNNEVVALHN